MLRELEISVLYLHIICGEMRDLVPFLQFKIREKHPQGSVTLSKVAAFSLQLY